MIRIPPRSPLRLAVLISGGGTTLRNLLDQIDAGRLDARIELVVSSHSKAGGLNFAAEAGVPASVVRQGDYDSAEAFSRAVFDPCREAGVDAVAMGGWLKLVPIPSDFLHRVLNIHPALIPAFCGHGYYGRRVHQAVLDYGAKVSGCTVHLVDQHYDHGPIILQRTVGVLDDDTPETLSARVFQAECEAYPEALRRYASGRMVIEGRHVRGFDPNV